MDASQNNSVSNTYSQEEQTPVTRWYCDTDCRASNRACRGEKGKDPTAKNLCPYYEDMLF
ncbi:MAG: hypothetical protein J6B28_07310 [Eubacterium sp.]|nr:hypothetical protein [Eubacterium sp.]